MGGLIASTSVITPCYLLGVCESPSNLSMFIGKLYTIKYWCYKEEISESDLTRWEGWGYA